MPIPHEQWELVGKRWINVEELLDSAGATGTDAKAKIESLRGRLSEAQIVDLNYVRQQRNRLFHHPAHALDDQPEWIRRCDVCILALRRVTANGRHRTSSKKIGTNNTSVRILSGTFAAVILVSLKEIHGEPLSFIIMFGVMIWLAWIAFRD